MPIVPNSPLHGARDRRPERPVKVAVAPVRFQPVGYIGLLEQGSRILPALLHGIEAFVVGGVRKQVRNPAEMVERFNRYIKPSNEDAVVI